MATPGEYWQGLDPGTRLLNIYAMHHPANYYPNLDRFSVENERRLP